LETTKSRIEKKVVKKILHYHNKKAKLNTWLFEDLS